MEKFKISQIKKNSRNKFSRLKTKIYATETNIKERII